MARIKGTVQRVARNPELKQQTPAPGQEWQTTVVRGRENGLRYPSLIVKVLGRVGRRMEWTIYHGADERIADVPQVMSTRRFMKEFVPYHQKNGLATRDPLLRPSQLPKSQQALLRE